MVDREKGHGRLGPHIYQLINLFNIYNIAHSYGVCLQTTKGVILQKLKASIKMAKKKSLSLRKTTIQKK